MLLEMAQRDTNKDRLLGTKFNNSAIARLLSVSEAQLERIDVDLTPYRAFCTQKSSDALSEEIAARDVKDIILIADDIRHGLPRGEVKQNFWNRLPETERGRTVDNTDSSVDLAASLVSMTQIGRLKYGFSGRDDELSWTDDSLQTRLSGHFKRVPELGNDVRLEDTFNARNLSEIAGFHIEWTDNLAEHLRWSEENKTWLRIFPHVMFLTSQLEKKYVAIKRDGV
jgi:hypothetical protein